MNLLPSIVLSLLGTATSSAGGALWSPRGFDAGEREEVELLERALARSLGVRLLDRDDIAEELRHLAHEPAGDRRRGAAEALRAAREAFVELRIAPSMKAYQEAIDRTLEDDRRAVSARELAVVFFERALVSLAAHSRASATRDLRTAIALDPTLAPSPDVYGPPVLRAVAKVRAEAKRLPLVALRVDRAPEDAIVHVDGIPVAPGEVVRVRGRGPHLITAERPWHLPRSQLVELETRGTNVRAIVLERATGTSLAAHVLDAWRAHGDAPLEGELMVMIARSLGITSVVEATKLPSGELDVVLRDAASGEVARAVRGRRTEWEPYAYAALAEALEGRVLEPPPEPVELTLSLSAPSRVAPESPIPLNVDLRDPARRVRRLEARCGGETVAADIAGDRDQSTHRLLLAAPDEETTMACQVLGLDAARETVVRAPPEGGRVEVAVVEDEVSWYRRWYVWGSIGAAIAGGAALAIVLQTDDPDPRRELVINVAP